MPDRLSNPVPSDEEWLAELMPAYWERRRRLLDHVFAPATPTYPVAHRYVIAGLVAATRGSRLTSAYFGAAIDAGATGAVLLEAILVAERPGGATMLQNALQALGELVQAGSLVLPPQPPPVEAASGGTGLDDKRGYAFKAFDLLHQHDPEYDEARRGLTSWVYDPGDSLLTARDREIIAGTVLSSRFYPSAQSHFGRALREGAPVLEIIEALEAAAVPGGGPTMHFGLEMLGEIVGGT